MTNRSDGRSADQLRNVTFNRQWLDHAEGSVLVEFGATKVLCAVSFSEGVPRWKKGSGSGWVTAEYSMLPRATNTRSDRESVKGKLGGRTQEISRLVGRSLRAIVDMKELGENTIVIDCDVLQADGGTRTAAITGAYVAVALVHLSYAHERKFAAGVLGLIVLKLIWENTIGNTSTAELIGSPVLIEAHLLGALWGMLLAAIYFPFHLQLLKPKS